MSLVCCAAESEWALGVQTYAAKPKTASAQLGVQFRVLISALGPGTAGLGSQKRPVNRHSQKLPRDCSNVSLSGLRLIRLREPMRTKVWNINEPVLGYLAILQIRKIAPGSPSSLYRQVQDKFATKVSPVILLLSSRRRRSPSGG